MKIKKTTILNILLILLLIFNFSCQIEQDLIRSETKENQFIAKKNSFARYHLNSSFEKYRGCKSFDK